MSRSQLHDHRDFAWFRRLYDTHHDPIARYALRRSSTAVAQDVASETFAIAWRRRSEMPSNEEEQLLWLYGVARLTLANAQRSVRRQDRLLMRLLSERSTAPVAELDIADGVAEQSTLIAAMKHLSPSLQEALQLSAWEGLDIRSSAAVAGCSESAMAARLSRARRRLRDLLLEIRPENELAMLSKEPSS